MMYILTLSDIPENRLECKKMFCKLMLYALNFVLFIVKLLSVVVNVILPNPREPVSIVFYCQRKVSANISTDTTSCRVTSWQPLCQHQLIRTCTVLVNQRNIYTNWLKIWQHVPLFIRYL